METKSSMVTLTLAGLRYNAEIITRQLSEQFNYDIVVFYNQQWKTHDELLIEMEKWPLFWVLLKKHIRDGKAEDFLLSSPVIKKARVNQAVRNNLLLR